MDPSENPNSYDDYRALKWQLACEALAADFNAAVERIVEPICRWLENALEKLWSWIRKTAIRFWNFIRRVYGKPKTRKLIRLALYAKKARTRKKNAHRILKIISE